MRNLKSGEIALGSSLALKGSDTRLCKPLGAKPADPSTTLTLHSVEPCFGMPLFQQTAHYTVMTHIPPTHSLVLSSASFQCHDLCEYYCSRHELQPCSPHNTGDDRIRPFWLPIKSTTHTPSSQKKHECECHALASLPSCLTPQQYSIQQCHQHVQPHTQPWEGMHPAIPSTCLIRLTDYASLSPVWRGVLGLCFSYQGAISPSPVQP
jgi:hypothetical protein